MTRPWHTVECVRTDEGLLELRQRGERDFLITIDSRVLMNASANVSEIVLAQRACEPLKNRKAPRVLVGGLGMGFTLKAALDVLPTDAGILVAELNPVVVQWCRGPLAGLTGAAVDDPRVAVVISDVAALIGRAAGGGPKERFDAIVLDLYEGPCGHDPKSGTHLYGTGALESSRKALTAGGILAVWSEEPDAPFEKRLKKARFAVDRLRPGRGGRHAVYIARKPV